MAIKNRVTAEPYRKYLKRLQEEYHLKLMGRGSFGHVFQHPTLKNVVVKVYERNTYTQGLFWLRWCAKNQRNPYVPRIYKMGKLKDLQTKDPSVMAYHIVFMEKLEPSSARVLKDFFVQKEVCPDIMEFDTADGRWYFSEALRRQKTDFHLRDRNLESALKKIYQLSARSSADVTTRNVMMRGSQLVFTDPVE